MAATTHTACDHFKTGNTFFIFDFICFIIIEIKNRANFGFTRVLIVGFGYKRTTTTNLEEKFSCPSGFIQIMVLNYLGYFLNDSPYPKASFSILIFYNRFACRKIFFLSLNKSLN
jgi:hypothetical protein